MHVRYLLFFVLLFFVSTHGVAQNNEWCISGVILDSESKQPIASVHVALADMAQGCVSDGYGKFKLCCSTKDSVLLQFFHTSYNQYRKIIESDSSNNIKIYLTTQKYQTEEVIIKSNSSSMVKGIIPGKIELKQKEILLTPAILGAPDLVRTLQLLPGIQSVNEGNSGIYVRGGSPGHNYIVFDDIELMNPSHLMGIYSVFNPLLVDKVDFYKGNAPIHQSSRLASSIIVKTKNKGDQSYNWAGNIGNISSNITYNGTSKNKKWYTNIGFRRSYLEVIQTLAKPLMSDEINYFESNHFNFHDFNGKIRYKSGANTLALSWYKGKDDFEFSNPNGDVDLNNQWGNEGISLVWNHMFMPNLSMKNTVSYSGYLSSLKIDFMDQNLKFDTDYKHLQFKSDFTLQKNKHLIRWGSHLTHRYISPQDIDISLNTNTRNSFNSYEHLMAKLLASNHFTYSEKLEFYVGAAVEYYSQLDKEMDYNVDMALNNKLDKDEIFLNGVFTVNYKLSPNTSIKGSYSYISQNIHLTSVASIPLPSDIWMPATQNVPAEQGHQFTLGYFKELSKYGIEYGIEGYGKLLENQVMMKVNVDDEETKSFEDSFFGGKGKAFGSEIYIKKTGDKLNANISYTLGWVRQKFKEINEGKWHDAKYDRRHDLNVLCSYKLNSRIELGGVFIFATGNKATLPTGRYWLMGNVANDYEGVNNYRMPVYHRLDLSMNYYIKSKTFKESILNFSLINVLNRSNPYFVYFSVEQGAGSYELDIKARQVSLFPILPSVSWRFKF